MLLQNMKMENNIENVSVDSLLLEQLRSEQEYWQTVLTGMISVIRFGAFL